MAAGAGAGAVAALGSRGILSAVRDLPKTEALGIELRASGALAAPVSVLDGSFVNERLRIRYELGDDPAENQAIISRYLVQIVEHFNWKGVTGLSVTKKLCQKLGIVGEDFHTLGKECGQMLAKFLRTKVSFCHTLVHTDAAGFNELVWGESAKEDEHWRGKIILICTLGKHLGAVLFNDGRRVRNSPVQSSLATMPGWDKDGKFTPPEPDDQEFDSWAELVDHRVSDILSVVTTLDRIIVVPTGRTARSGRLPAALLPKLSRTQAAAAAKQCEVSVIEQSEGSLVRGVAMCSLVELQTTQVLRSLESVVNHEQAMNSLSEQQLRVIFDKMDLDCDGEIAPQELRDALFLLGIQRDMDKLLSELDASTDGVVTFNEFITWWRQQVMAARVVLLTSDSAWRSIISSSPPPGFGQLIVLGITFTFCRTCRSFEPKFQKLAEKYPNVRFSQLIGNATIGAMDFCTKELGVKVSPAFFIFRRGGELLRQWTGANVEKFEANVTECLAQYPEA